MQSLIRLKYLQLHSFYDLIDESSWGIDCFPMPTLARAYINSACCLQACIKYWTLLLNLCYHYTSFACTVIVYYFKFKASWMINKVQHKIIMLLPVCVCFLVILIHDIKCNNESSELSTCPTTYLHIFQQRIADNTCRHLSLWVQGDTAKKCIRDGSSRRQ